MTDWKYGDVVRRKITENPVQYTKVMYIGNANELFSGREIYFVGIQLTDFPPAAAGTWINPPKPGHIRPRLKRALFEKEPDDE